MNRKTIFLATSLALALSMSSGQPAVAAIGPIYGGTARLAADGPILTREPARAVTGAERLLARAAHCTIADITAAVELVDDTKVRLRLLDNLLFHDGTLLRAIDVERSLRRVASMDPPSPAAWRLLSIARSKDSESNEDERLAITTTSPTSLEIGIVSSRLDIMAWLDDPGLSIVKSDGLTGCGPFKVSTAIETPLDTSRTRQERPDILLAPFERHPGGRPFLDSIELVAVPPASSTQASIDGLDGGIGIGSANHDPISAVLEHQLVSLRLKGHNATNRVILRRISKMMDREAMARLFLGPGASPIVTLSQLLDPSEQAGRASTSRYATPANRETSLPGRITIAYDSDDPVLRRLAERIQLRLHDEGSHALLSPVNEIDETSSPLHPLIVLDVQPELPRCPMMRLIAIAHHHGGREVAHRTLKDLLSRSPPTPADAFMASLEIELGLIPLATISKPSWLAENLHVAPGARAGTLHPADIWLWPGDLARPVSVHHGGW